ncbi:MAG: hypothetical protein KJ795_11175 [Gammaproteobacteria bacterium]|nr:hypothetical protein [Gammaproteobacteria bacterium]MBU1776945.1 hypothetical protein [Gammaproteobacteria bacterium]MBU1968582.1 hypothetical protein [Gammaproteobacteria bacterium]
MNIASLSPDQAPPISIPLRFFAVAPLFLIVAALILLAGDAAPFADAHSPALLAATHCITLGFMATVMMGATQQILPVVVGSPVPASRLVAWFTLLPLAAGTLLLTAGFLRSDARLLGLAWPLLATAFAVFIAAALVSLWRARTHNLTWIAILLALLALAGAVTLGTLLDRGYAAGMALDYARLSAMHIGLALGGWVLLLIVGVSYQVVPMFQITPGYPKWLGDLLAPSLFAALLLNLASLSLGEAPLRNAVAESVFWLLAISFAVTTLWLQHHRRRKISDATLSFFRLGMFALMFAAACSFAALALPAAAAPLRMLSIIAFIGGFAMSLIQGMLYKIVPFLVWFHLFRGGSNALRAGIPNMKEVIAERLIWWHLRLHVFTLLAALPAPWWDVAVWPLALGLLLQGMLLAYAMYAGIAVFRRTLARIANLASDSVTNDRPGPP